MQGIERAYGRLLELFAAAACVLIFGMTLMICADVFLRNVRVVPGVAGLAWSAEISEAMLFLVTLLTAPWLLRRGQHIRVDIVLRMIPAKLGWAMEWLGDVTGFVCSLFFIWYGARATAASYFAGSLSIKTLIFPEWWILLPMPICFLLVAVEFVFRMRALARAERAPRDDAVSTG